MSASDPVAIEKPVYGGQFLARREGKAVFVPLALPGEEVSLRRVEERRGYATAEIDRILAPAPARVAPRCPHFGSCGGCDYQHTDYATELGLKQAILAETLERGGVRIPGPIGLLTAEPWAYRNRIRLAFDEAGNPGYRGRRSHAVTPIGECPIAAPLLVRAAFALRELLGSMAPGLDLAELALFTNHDQSALLAGILLRRRTRVRLPELARALGERTPELRGVEVAFEPPRRQSPETMARWGEGSLAYRAAGFDYRVDHGAFFQVNRWLVDALVERVTSGHRGGVAWDMFAGVGLFARPLAAAFEEVVAVESAPASRAALAANLKGTPGRVAAMPVLDFLRRASGPPPDLAVVDPPRAGLGPETIALLASRAPARLVYVSCDPATLARDLRGLAAAGYGVRSVTLADLFPRTFHLETVVDLGRE